MPFWQPCHDPNPSLPNEICTIGSGKRLSPRHGKILDHVASISSSSDLPSTAGFHTLLRNPNNRELSRAPSTSGRHLHLSALRPRRPCRPCLPRLPEPPRRTLAAPRVRSRQGAAKLRQFFLVGTKLQLPEAARKILGDAHEKI